MKYELRAYQQNDVRNILGALLRYESVLYCSPTGSGKTATATYLAAQWMWSGKRVLILAHRVELIEQMLRGLRAHGVPGDRVGVIRGSDRRARPCAPIQVASVDTLVGRKCPPVDYVIIDEAQHTVAETWSRILSWCVGAKRLGLSAAPQRLDGVPLKQMFEELVLGPSVSSLIEDGWLRKPRCFVSERVDSRGRAHHVRGLRRGRSLIGCLRTALEHHAQDRNGVVFASSVQHANLVHESLRDTRWHCRVITGDTPERERRDTLDPGAWLDRGARRLVLSCDVLNEGYDLPSLKLAVLARHTHSLALYLQQVGRIMRPYSAGEHDAEWSPMVLDQAGNVLRFGVPSEDRTWTLDGIEPDGRFGGGDGSRFPRAKACPMCGEAAPTSATVCACGYEFKEFRTPREIASIRLRELAPATDEERETFELQRKPVIRQRLLDEGLPVEEAERLAAHYAQMACVMRFGPRQEVA